jgi:hypothetical protein
METIWTRRDALRIGFLAAGSCLCGSVGRVAAQPLHRARRGCVVTTAEAHPLMSRAGQTRFYETGNEPMISNSGDKDFDFALAQTLAKISNLFGVLPDFGYYADDERHPNAFAVKTEKTNRDGTVLFGEHLLKNLLQSKESPDAAVAAVCAHEFGHILQFQHHLDDKVTAGQPTIKRAELQADYFAGYFAGVRKRERPTFPAAVFALTQFNFGDDDVERETHHGTKDERGAAISRGFEASFRDNLSLSAAIDASVAYVTRL